MDGFKILKNWGKLTSSAKSLQLCPTLCNPIDGSPPDSPVPGLTFNDIVNLTFNDIIKRKEKNH